MKPLLIGTYLAAIVLANLSISHWGQRDLDSG